MPAAVYSRVVTCISDKQMNQLCPKFCQSFDVWFASIVLILGIVLVSEVSNKQFDGKMSRVGVEFEVFGKVQGVFFRKFTQKQAKELGLVGTVKNTKNNTVVGYIEGDQAKINEMKHWLGNVGSPQSSIKNVEFKNEKTVESPTMTSFSILK